MSATPTPEMAEQPPDEELTTAATIDVMIALRTSLGFDGAPGSVPATTSPSSFWLRTPQGSTANSTTHQTTK